MEPGQGIQVSLNDDNGYRLCKIIMNSEVKRQVPIGFYRARGLNLEFGQYPFKLHSNFSPFDMQAPDLHKREDEIGKQLVDAIQVAGLKRVVFLSAL